MSWKELFDAICEKFGHRPTVADLTREYTIYTMRELAGQGMAPARRVLGVHSATLRKWLKKWGVAEEFPPRRRVGETELELYLRLKQKYEAAEAAE